MLELDLLPPRTQPYRILALGAHCDDIEIGCGGTILKLIRKHPSLDFHWIVFSSDDEREREARTAADRFLDGAGGRRVEIQRFRNGYFPWVGAEIKDFFEDLKARVDPALILTHHRNDLHQDHRTICELTWNTFRDHLILEYEIPKYDSDLGSPNLFVSLEDKTARAKTKMIVDCYDSQTVKHWFTQDTLLGLMRLRGVQSGGASSYAEAFYCPKVRF